MGFLIRGIFNTWNLSALYAILKARKGPTVGAMNTGHALHVSKTLLYRGNPQHLEVRITCRCAWRPTERLAKQLHETNHAKGCGTNLLVPPGREVVLNMKFADMKTIGFAAGP